MRQTGVCAWGCVRNVVRIGVVDRGGEEEVL